MQHDAVQSSTEDTQVIIWDGDFSSGTITISLPWGEMAPVGTELTLAEWEARIHPEERAATLQALHDHLDGRTSRYESRFRTCAVSGEWRWVRERGTVVARDAAGRALRMTGVTLDVTDFHRAELIANAQRDIALAFSRSTSIEAICPMVMQTALQVSGLDCGVLFICNRQDGSLRMAHYSGLPHRFAATATSFSAQSPQVRLLVSPNPYFGLYDNLLERLPVPDPIRMAEGLRACAVLPIMDGDQLEAILFVASHTLETISDLAQEALLAVAAHTGVVLARGWAEEAMWESESRYRTLFDCTNDAIFIHDEQGQFLEVNRAACEMLGYSRDELLQMGSRELDSPEFQPLVAARIEANFRSGSNIYETEFVRKDGTILPIELSCRVIEYEGIAAVLGVARDVTERRRNEERERQLAQLQETEHLRSEFLTAVSHELKTPLTPILGGAELLMSGGLGPVDERQHQVLAMISRQGRRLLRLIEDMLDLSRIEAGYMPVQATSVDLRRVLTECVTASSGPLHDRGVALDFKCPPLPAISGDAQRLGQIFDNLLSNAAKFTDQGAVRVRAKVEDTHVVVRIADTGIGMSAYDRQRVFQRFYQVDQHRPGAGLGLSITKYLIDAHGGTIEVKSKLGVGSTFTVRLPIAAPPSAK